MRKKAYYLTIVLAAVLMSIHMSFKNHGKQHLETIQTHFKEDLTAFEAEFIKLKNYLTPAHQADTVGLRLQFSKVRQAYKRIEYLVDYLSPQYAKDYLNGAPLPKIARNEAGVNVVAPVSLQVMEEYVYSSDAARHHKDLLQQYESIRASFGELHLMGNTTITERHIYEAVRYELIRIMSMGLTGFDTPASGESLKECAVAFETIAASFTAIAKNHKNLHSEAQQIEQLFRQGKKYLQQNQDFDSFDRLYFTRNVIQPLYAALGAFHTKSGVETIYETNSTARAVNYLGKDLFSIELFDIGFYNPYLGSTPRRAELLALGKNLFFDPILSHNQQRSCASCHKPDKAFSDGIAKSIAYDFKGTVDRNAPTLVNSVLSMRQFWDMRAHDLDMQTEHVIFSEKEFHSNYDTIIARLKQSKEYQEQFAGAFPDYKGAIHKETFTKALVGYVSSLSSFNSVFDKYMRAESTLIDSNTYKGYNLFMGKAACGTCHFAPSFAGLVPPFFDDSEGEVLGVPDTKEGKSIDGDLGRAMGQMKERSPIYNHAFKTPTLRNVALTAPYMHNGVFDSLEEVLDFYNKGGGQGLGLHVPNQTLPPDPLDLSPSETRAIIAFMKALTDTTGMNPKRVYLPKFTTERWNNRTPGGNY